MKEQPYDATSDLWSLGKLTEVVPSAVRSPSTFLIVRTVLSSVGVILYELYVGQPPFYTNSIYSLINHIVKDPVKYPTDISKEFKTFLQGTTSPSYNHIYVMHNDNVHAISNT